MESLERFIGFIVFRDSVAFRVTRLFRVRAFGVFSYHSHLSRGGFLAFFFTRDAPSMNLLVGPRSDLLFGARCSLIGIKIHVVSGLWGRNLGTR